MLRIVFSEYYAALQMVFSLLINSNGKKSSVLLDSILTHLYATTKFLKIWVSENPISSHLMQSEVTSSTLIPNLTRRLYIRFVNSISTPAEMMKRWSLFSTHVQLFFLAVCILWNGIQFMVFIVWLQSPLEAASVRTWSAIFRAIQIVGTFSGIAPISIFTGLAATNGCSLVVTNFGFLLGLLQSWLPQGRISVVLISLCATACCLFCLANLLSQS